MKPTKIRNQTIYQAANAVRSRQLGAALSDDLRGKYGRRSVRVAAGDGVEVVRGEFRGVTGKVSDVSTAKGRIAIEGVKNEKAKGDKFDVYVHSSNLVVTSLNTEDKWRMAKIEGKDRKDHSPRDGAASPPAGAGPAAPEPAGAGPQGAGDAAPQEGPARSGDGDAGQDGAGPQGAGDAAPQGQDPGPGGEAPDAGTGDKGRSDG